MIELLFQHKLNEIILKKFFYNFLNVRHGWSALLRSKTLCTRITHKCIKKLIKTVINMLFITRNFLLNTLWYFCMRLIIFILNLI